MALMSRAMIVATLLAATIEPTRSTTTAIPELVEARAEIARLRAQVAGLSASGGAEGLDADQQVLVVRNGEVSAVALNSSIVAGLLARTSTAAPTVLVSGIAVEQNLVEAYVLMPVVLVFLGLLWFIPLSKPCKKTCETRKHKIYKWILLISIIVLGFAFNILYTVTVNEFFFDCVKVVEVAINKLEQGLIGSAALFVLIMLWKFKDRVLEALGVENPQFFVGEFRDWATCWSMRRFAPLELFILKVEGLPSSKVNTDNDIFAEVSLGYNVTMRTRVHARAGHSCVFKESMQLNWDPYDNEAKLTLSIKNQDVLGSTTIASVQFGMQQLKNLEEPHPGSAEGGPSSRTIGWGATSGQTSTVWGASAFKTIDLIPAGKIYLRFAALPPDEV